MSIEKGYLRLSVCLLMTLTAAAAGSTARAAERHSAKRPGRSESAQPAPSPGPPHAGTKSSSTTAVEEISVTAHHLGHANTVTIRQALLAQAIPGANPMRTLAQLPGVMFQSDDPQGLNTWSAQIFMHGFQQQEIGMTLDGLPLGEMTYRNYNGLQPTQAISAENIAAIDTSLAAGAETVAATNNLGGSLQYQSSDPKSRTSGTLSQSFGSNATYHTFIRIDSGRLNESGTKFFVSYMRNDARLWKGYGEQFTQQFNAKVVQPVGSNSKITAFFDWSDLHQDINPDYSLDMLDNVGYDVAYYQNGRPSGYLTAIRAADGVYPPGFAKLSDPLDAAYYDGGTNVMDLLGRLTADLALTDQWRWTTTVYGHNEQTQTTWGTPYFGSPTGSPISEIVKEPVIKRLGLLSAAYYDIARNKIGAGVWYENNSYASPMNAYAEPAVIDGVVQGPIPYDLDRYTNPFARIFNQDYSTNTLTGFVQDVYRPIRSLEIHLGFKSVLNTTRVGNGYLNPVYYGNTDPITSGVGLTTAKAFLPHIGLDWRFLQGHEIFVDISQNIHTYAQSGYKLSNSPFAVLQSAFDAGVDALRPETAWTYAVGYRYTSTRLAASLYAYRTNFFNRLQQITAGSPVNPVSAVANVGGVTMNGIDAGLTVTPVTHVSLYNSVSYDHAVYDNNIGQEDLIYDTKGKQIVNYPVFMYKSRLSVDYGRIRAWIDGNYTSRRNFSYTGDTKTPGYWTSNIGIDYDIGPMGKYHDSKSVVHDIIVSFHVDNLTNTKYISTMGENGNPLSISTGSLTEQSFLLGAPRQFFGSIRAEF